MKTAAQTGEGGAFTNSFLRSGANIKIKTSLKSILTCVMKTILNFIHLSFLGCNTHKSDVRATCRTVTDRQSHQNQKRAFNMAVKFNY